MQAPVIETSLDPLSKRFPSEQKVIEEVPSVVDALVEEPQVDSDFVIKTMPEAVDVPEVPVEAPVEASVVEEPVVEAAVETIVEETPAVAVEAKLKDEFFIDSEPESPVEAPVTEEPVDSPVEEFEMWKEDITSMSRDPSELQSNHLSRRSRSHERRSEGLEVEETETNAAVAVEIPSQCRRMSRR